jgi:hypothetical protein
MLARGSPQSYACATMRIAAIRQDAAVVEEANRGVGVCRCGAYATMGSNVPASGAAGDG